MKTNKLTLLIFGLIIGFSTTTFAQDQDAKKQACEAKLSGFHEFVKQKDYIDAVPMWREVYSECPDIHKNVFIEGAKIYRYFLKKETDATKKAALLDTLMNIYDLRIKYFGDTAVNLGRKGADLYKYDKKQYKTAFDLCSKSYNALGDKTSINTVYTLFRIAHKMVRKNELEKDKYVDIFVSVESFLDKKIMTTTNEKKKSKLEKMKQIVEDTFAKSPAADCSTLESVYKPKLEANKTNVDFLKKTSAILQKVKCTESDFYTEVAEDLYAQEPSSEAAYGIAKIFLRKNDFGKAAKYYKEAIDKATDSTANKADLYYELAVIQGGKLNQKESARANALKAASLRSGWGKPYLLIGNLYAASANSVGKDEFEHKTVYWAAVDMFIKAKSIDPSVAESANKSIAKYKVYFPKKEDAFFHQITEGKEVTIGGWINTTTKARF